MNFASPRIFLQFFLAYHMLQKCFPGASCCPRNKIRTTIVIDQLATSLELVNGFQQCHDKYKVVNIPMGKDQFSLH